ncbi:hypothetical protein, conserved (fragment), partial [Trypanosoma vivax Y486]
MDEGSWKMMGPGSTSPTGGGWRCVTDSGLSCVGSTASLEETEQLLRSEIVACHLESIARQQVVFAMQKLRLTVKIERQQVHDDYLSHLVMLRDVMLYEEEALMERRVGIGSGMWDDTNSRNLQSASSRDDPDTVSSGHSEGSVCKHALCVSGSNCQVAVRGSSDECSSSASSYFGAAGADERHVEGKARQISSTYMKRYLPSDEGTVESEELVGQIAERGARHLAGLNYRGVRARTTQSNYCYEGFGFQEQAPSVPLVLGHQRANIRSAQEQLNEALCAQREGGSSCAAGGDLQTNLALQRRVDDKRVVGELCSRSSVGPSGTHGHGGPDSDGGSDVRWLASPLPMAFSEHLSKEVVSQRAKEANERDYTLSGNWTSALPCQQRFSCYAAGEGLGRPNVNDQEVPDISSKWYVGFSQDGRVYPIRPEVPHNLSDLWSRSATTTEETGSQCSLSMYVIYGRGNKVAGDAVGKVPEECSFSCSGTETYSDSSLDMPNSNYLDVFMPPEPMRQRFRRVGVNMCSEVQEITLNHNYSESDTDGSEQTPAVSAKGCAGKRGQSFALRGKAYEAEFSEQSVTTDDEDLLEQSIVPAIRVRRQATQRGCTRIKEEMDDSNSTSTTSEEMAMPLTIVGRVQRVRSVQQKNDTEEAIQAKQHSSSNSSDEEVERAGVCTYRRRRTNGKKVEVATEIQHAEDEEGEKAKEETEGEKGQLTAAIRRSKNKRKASGSEQRTMEVNFGTFNETTSGESTEASESMTIICSKKRRSENNREKIYEETIQQQSKESSDSEQERNIAEIYTGPKRRKSQQSLESFTNTEQQNETTEETEEEEEISTQQYTRQHNRQIQYNKQKEEEMNKEITCQNKRCENYGRQKQTKKETCVERPLSAGSECGGDAVPRVAALCEAPVNVETCAERPPSAGSECGGDAVPRVAALCEAPVNVETCAERPPSAGSECGGDAVPRVAALCEAPVNVETCAERPLSAGSECGGDAVPRVAALCEAPVNVETCAERPPSAGSECGGDAVPRVAALCEAPVNVETCAERPLSAGSECGGDAVPRVAALCEAPVNVETCAERPPSAGSECGGDAVPRVAALCEAPVNVETCAERPLSAGSECGGDAVPRVAALCEAPVNVETCAERPLSAGSECGGDAVPRVAALCEAPVNVETCAERPLSAGSECGG